MKNKYAKGLTGKNCGEKRENQKLNARTIVELGEQCELCETADETKRRRTT